MHEFDELEQAVMLQLEPLKANGLRTLEPYVNQLEVEDLEALEAQAVHWPAIFVTASGLEINVRNRDDAYRLGLMLFVCDRNVRGGRGAVQGDALSPGIYNLLALTRNRLHRRIVTAGWGPLEAQREIPFIWHAKKRICVFAAQYETRADIRA